MTTTTLTYADAHAMLRRLYAERGDMTREAFESRRDAIVSRYRPLAEQARAAVAAYDRIVRANTTPRYDAVAAVATCDDGIYGAWGEVIDTAEERGYPVTDDAALDVLEAEYERLRARYRTER